MSDDFLRSALTRGLGDLDAAARRTAAAGAQRGTPGLEAGMSAAAEGSAFASAILAATKARLSEIKTVTR